MLSNLEKKLWLEFHLKKKKVLEDLRIYYENIEGQKSYYLCFREKICAWNVLGFCQKAKPSCDLPLLLCSHDPV